MSGSMPPRDRQRLEHVLAEMGLDLDELLGLLRPRIEEMVEEAINRSPLIVELQDALRESWRTIGAKDGTIDEMQFLLNESMDVTSQWKTMLHAAERRIRELEDVATAVEGRVN